MAMTRAWSDDLCETRAGLVLTGDEIRAGSYARVPGSESLDGKHPTRLTLHN